MDASPDLESLVPVIRQDLVIRPRSGGHDGQSGTWLIESPSLKRFYNIGQREYHLLCYLDGKRSHREAYDMYLAAHDASNRRAGRKPDSTQTSNARHAPLTWQQALAFFQFLAAESLLESVDGKSIPTPPQQDSKRLRWNPVGVRLRLFSADKLAQQLLQVFKWLFSTPAFVAWLVIMAWAGTIAFGLFDRMTADSVVLIQSENWFWLTICWILLKCVHEAGHAISCRIHSGEVGDAGINFLLLLPMPYVDVTSSWRFNSPWHRIKVAAAGMYLELAVAAICVIVWSFDLSPSINAVALQVVIMASLTTLLFNANPLMRFDGYYILSDLFGRPNLSTNGVRYQRAWLKNRLLGMEVRDDFRSFDLFTKIYGWLAAAWRIVVAVGLIMAATALLHGAGIVLAGIAIFVWWIMPLSNFVRSCFGPSPSHIIDRRRAAMSTAIGLGVLCILSYIPWPFAPTAVGVVEHAEKEIVRTDSAGFVEEVLVTDGQQVTKGQVLARLRNPELAFDLESLKIDHRIAVTEARHLKKQSKLSEYQAEVKKIEELTEQLTIVTDQLNQLVIKAPVSGTVVGGDLDNLTGAFMKQGTELLRITTSQEFAVHACVKEVDLPLFQRSRHQRVLINLQSGQAGTSRLASVEPSASREIFHPAISADVNGPLSVRPSESDDGWELATPVCSIRTDAIRLPDSATQIRPGQLCRVTLTKQSHTCLEAVTHKVANWLRTSWKRTTDANRS